MDPFIRTHVKDILHLPSSTLNGLIYCSKRDGGLGIPQLETLGTSKVLKQGIQLLAITDEATQVLFRTTNFEQRLERMAKSIQIKWPISNTKCIDTHKCSQQAIELRGWSQLPSIGKSVLQFADDRYGNCWLYIPSLLKPSRYLAALKVRSGNTSDRVTLNKAIPQVTLKCWKCKSCVETLVHILGQFTYTKSSRIRRHDKIHNFVAQILATNTSEFQLIEEASIATPSGTLKLVVVHQGKVQVVDVTVRHEDTGYLEEHHNSKVAKHTLLPQLATQMKLVPGNVLPTVIGTRGAIPKSTLSSLKELKITDQGSYSTLALLALWISIETYHCFMDTHPTKNWG